MSENNRRCALSKVGTVFKNHNGLAVIVVLKRWSSIHCSPGPPNELKMMQKEVLPFYVREQSDLFESRYLRLFGIDNLD